MLLHICESNIVKIVLLSTIIIAVPHLRFNFLDPAHVISSCSIIIFIILLLSKHSECGKPNILLAA